MTHLEIEYCVPCGLLQSALKIETVLLEEFGRDIDGLTLTTGAGGLLAVRMDDKTIYNNQRDGPELDLNELVEAIDTRLDIAA